MSDALTLSFAEVGVHDLARVGGKGANLGALTRMGLSVPAGFCVTTTAFRQFVDADAEFDRLLAALTALEAGDLPGAREHGAAVRAHLESRPVPPAIRDAIQAELASAPEGTAWAVRSSATAEDLPGASFAGQQDTYLNVVGAESVVERVRACWASLYTDRAILYRQQQGIPHRGVSLSAVVQRMVQPTSSGILFTADPVSGNRRVMAIDSGFGLGEALVSGTVSADLFRVDRDSGRVIETTLATKESAIRSLEGGGTEIQTLAESEATKASLTEAQIAQLVAAGETIETAQGCPQDIEWCFDDSGLHIVQARPITSLFPLPTDELAPHRLWFCFNHFQVMTDAMPPLASDIWSLMMPLGRKLQGDPRIGDNVRTAAGRLFIDFGPFVRFPPTRFMLLNGLKSAEALAADALANVVDRPQFREGPRASLLGVLRFLGPKFLLFQKHMWFARLDSVRPTREAWLDGIVQRIVAVTRRGTEVERLVATRRALSDLFGTIMVLPAVVIPGIVASKALHRLLPEHSEDIDALGRGLDGNVAVTMDLAVGDLADVARGLPAVQSALLAGEDWSAVQGAASFRDALEEFLDQWGARAASEIDYSRPRWREDPSSILSAVAGNLAVGEPGGHREHHARLQTAGLAAQQRLIQAAGGGLFGFIKRPLVRRFTKLVRALMPMREHPKFALVRIGDAVRQLAMELGEKLAREERLLEPNDVWFLRWQELEDAAEGFDDYRVIVGQRKAVHARHQALYPPRLMTGTGEIPQGKHSQEVPEGAWAGTAASPGVVEGIARVILDPRTEVLHKGEILVAPFTDPGWTPLFINAAGLVMEVGGVMTHGSLVAREYGIPAVVCVPGVTTAITTGQRIRVHGGEGWVQVIDEGDSSAS